MSKIQPPTISYQDNDYLMIYVGRRKIDAIKAVRNTFGLTLKSAKDIVEWPGGFVVKGSQYRVVRKIYLDGSFPQELSEKDWTVTRVGIPPVDLRKTS